MFKDYSINIKKHNPVAYKLITGSKNMNKVPHALLFSAPHGYKINDEIYFFMQTIISNGFERDVTTFPDLIELNSENTTIKKQDLLNAVESMKDTPLDRENKKFLVIHNIEKANTQTLNSLLKFLEEPTKDTFILITTNKINALLTTIRSRTQIINLTPPSPTSIQEELDAKYPEELKRIASNFKRTVAEANAFLEDEENQFLVSKVKEALKEGLSNKELLSLSLLKIISKMNFEIILNILFMFYFDLSRESETSRIFQEDSLVEEYKQKKFDFASALKTINRALSDKNLNLNFDLWKTIIFIDLEDCYE